MQAVLGGEHGCLCVRAVGGKLVIAVVVLMVVPTQCSEMQTGAVCS